MKNLLALALLPLLLAGCASRQRFGYPVSPAPSRTAAVKTVEILPISDTRTNRLIDSHFTTNLLADVREVVGKELESTGLFKPLNTLALTPTETDDFSRRDFVRSPREREERPAMTLKTELARLEWEVPHYNRMIGITFAASLLTGGIAG